MRNPSPDKLLIVVFILISRRKETRTTDKSQSDFSPYLVRSENDKTNDAHSVGTGGLYCGLEYLATPVISISKRTKYQLIKAAENKLQIVLPDGFHPENICGGWEITKLTTTENKLRTESLNALKAIHFTAN